MRTVTGNQSDDGEDSVRPDFVLCDRYGTTCEPRFTELLSDTLASIEAITAAGLDPHACGEPLPPQSIRGREGSVRPIRLSTLAPNSSLRRKRAYGI